MSVQGFPEEDVETGTRIAVSPTTDEIYVVREWVDKGAGAITALEKDSVVDRLFVPVRSEYYRAYEAGPKDVELRGIDDRFNAATVTVGRPVEIRRGYATDDSLWTLVADVWTFSTPAEIPARIDHERILPGATREEFLDVVDELLGAYDRWIAFSIRGVLD